MEYKVIGTCKRSVATYDRRTVKHSYAEFVRWAVRFAPGAWSLMGSTTTQRYTLNLPWVYVMGSSRGRVKGYTVEAIYILCSMRPYGIKSLKTGTAKLYAPPLPHLSKSGGCFLPFVDPIDRPLNNEVIAQHAWEVVANTSNKYYVYGFGEARKVMAELGLHVSTTSNAARSLGKLETLDDRQIRKVIRAEPVDNRGYQAAMRGLKAS